MLRRASQKLRRLCPCWHRRRSEPKPLEFVGFGKRRPGGRPKPLIKGFISQGQTSSLFAPPKHCKSTLTDDICRHVADVTETEWRGHKIKQHCGVLYLAFERSEQTLDA